MSRVEWTRQSGDDVEHLIAMFVCRERPRACRIRASRGDGGIDILVPVGDGRFDVYQVKKYASNLTSKQKDDIEESFTRLAAFANKHGWKIAHWYLVMPLDPTNENRAWFEALTGETPSSWQGLAHADGWAADYPRLVDYYLHGGKGELDGAYDKLQKLVADPSDARSVADRLRDHVLWLDEADPFYEFDFAVVHADEMPDLRDHTEGYLFRMCQGTLDGRVWVITSVRARFDEALIERPITFKGFVAVPNTPDKLRAFQDMWDYGAPYVTEPEAAELEFDAPSGLGFSDGKQATIHFGAIDVPPGEQFRLQIVHPGDHVAGEALFEMKKRSEGLKGTYLEASDVSGLITLRSMVDLETREGTMSLAQDVVCGRRPHHVMGPLRFMNSLAQPDARFRVAPLQGLANQTPMAIALPGESADRTGQEMVLRLVEALVIIQEHIGAQLVIPEFTELDSAQVAVAEWFAALLRDGEAPWPAQRIHLHPGVEPDYEPKQVLVIDNFSLAIGEAKLPIAKLGIWVPETVADRDRTTWHGDHWDVAVIALNSATAQLRAVLPLQA